MITEEMPLTIVLKFELLILAAFCVGVPELLALDGISPRGFGLNCEA